jgi:acylphosphatase
MQMFRHYLISGRVQGVGYRAFVHRTANELGLKGWVRNLADGSVEALVGGAIELQQQLEMELKKGPPRSLVESVHCRIVDVSIVWENFTIARDGDSTWSKPS